MALKPASCIPSEVNLGGIGWGKGCREGRERARVGDLATSKKATCLTQAPRRAVHWALPLSEPAEPHHKERYKKEASEVCVGPASGGSEGARVLGQRVLRRAEVRGLL